MTGAEHAAEAERLLERSADLARDPVNAESPARVAAIGSMLARAQVHATLALVAAVTPITDGSLYIEHYETRDGEKRSGIEVRGG